jgi:hypothetical protein
MRILPTEKHGDTVQGEGHEAVADLGGAVITGVNGNPLAVLARQLFIPLHRIDADQQDCPLYLSTGKPLSRAVDSLVCSLSQSRSDAASPNCGRDLVLTLRRTVVYFLYCKVYCIVELVLSSNAAHHLLILLAC